MKERHEFARGKARKCSRVRSRSCNAGIASQCYYRLSLCVYNTRFVILRFDVSSLLVVNALRLFNSYAIDL